jgi:hypothetical protein
MQTVCADVWPQQLLLSKLEHIELAFDAVQKRNRDGRRRGGGGYPGCAVGKACVVDSDCSRFDGLKCDPTLETCQKR